MTSNHEKKVTGDEGLRRFDFSSHQRQKSGWQRRIPGAFFYIQQLVCMQLFVYMQECGRSRLERGIDHFIEQVSWLLEICCQIPFHGAGHGLASVHDGIDELTQSRLNSILLNIAPVKLNDGRAMAVVK